MKTRISTLFVAFAIFCNYTLLPVWADGNVSVTASSKSTITKFNASSDINKVGNLVADDLAAIMDDAEVRIEKKDENGNKKTLLSGVIWKKSLKGKKLVSSVYFRDGKELESTLGDSSEEAVVKTDEKIYCGVVKDINRDRLTINDIETGEDITLQNEAIKSINSRRCFDVNMIIGESNISNPALDKSFTANVNKCQFKSAFDRKALERTIRAARKPKVQKGKASKAGVGSGLSPVAKIAIIGVGLALVATAIAVPIAVGVTQGNANRRRRNQNRQADNIQLFNFINQQQQPNLNQNQNQN